jgi:chaperone modulatory protein CbpM
MITIEMVITQIPGLRREDLERWIGNSWVRPDDHAGSYGFHEIDIARVRLIVELRDQMEVDEHALPVVLALLDQLYDTRRRMHDLCDALRRTMPPDLHPALAAALEGGRRDP